MEYLPVKKLLITVGEEQSGKHHNWMFLIWILFLYDFWSYNQICYKVTLKNVGIIWESKPWLRRTWDLQVNAFPDNSKFLTM